MTRPNARSRTTCSQCGRAFDARACGPTHALVAHERSKAFKMAARMVEASGAIESYWHGGRAELAASIRAKAAPTKKAKRKGTP